MNAAKKLKMIVTVLCYFSEVNLFSPANRVEAGAMKYNAIQYDGNVTAHEKFRKQQPKASTLILLKITGVFSKH